MTKIGKQLWQKEKFFSYVFKKPSAAEASESVYTRKRFKIYGGTCKGLRTLVKFKAETRL